MGSGYVGVGLLDGVQRVYSGWVVGVKAGGGGRALTKKRKASKRRGAPKYFGRRAQLCATCSCTNKYGPYRAYNSSVYRTAKAYTCRAHKQKSTHQRGSTHRCRLQGRVKSRAVEAQVQAKTKKRRNRLKWGKRKQGSAQAGRICKWAIRCT